MAVITLQKKQNLGVFGEIPLQTVDINPQGLQIDRTHWSLWLALANRHAIQSEEIGAIMILDAYNRILLAVPEQVPSGVNVHWESITTAVMIDGSALPLDYQEVGTIHSHHSMNCSFSCVDDAGDLKRGHPIAFHIVSRSYPQWQHDQSFCYNSQRILGDFGLVPEDVLPASESSLPTNLPIREYKPQLPATYSYQHYYSKWFEPKYGYNEHQSKKKQKPLVDGWSDHWFEPEYDYSKHQSGKKQKQSDHYLFEELSDELTRNTTPVSPAELYEFLSMYLENKDAYEIALDYQYYFMNINEIF